MVKAIKNNKLTSEEEIEVLVSIRYTLKHEMSFVDKFSKHQNMKSIVKDTRKTIKSLKSAYNKIAGYDYIDKRREE